MISIRSIEYMLTFSTFLPAYVITVSLAGCFRAWVAKKMGDDTAEKLGFLTLNPVKHMDPVGMFILFLFRFGWGRYIPINPFNFRGRYYKLKLAAAYFAKPFINLIVATLSLAFLIVSFGEGILYTVNQIIVGGRLYFSGFAQFYPEISSWFLAIAFIAIALVYLNVILAVLNFILDGFVFFTWLWKKEDVYRLSLTMSLIIPLFLIILLVDPIQYVVLLVISEVGNLLAVFFRMLWKI